MAIIKRVIDLEAPVPKDVLEEIEKASRKPVVPDEECQELTEEQLLELAELARLKRAKRVKKVVAIRISPATLEKAQKFGKGYTGVLSRILENALNNPDLLKQCL